MECNSTAISGQLLCIFPFLVLPPSYIHGTKNLDIRHTVIDSIGFNNIYCTGSMIGKPFGWEIQKQIHDDVIKDFVIKLY